MCGVLAADIVDQLFSFVPQQGLSKSHVCMPRRDGNGSIDIPKLGSALTTIAAALQRCGQQLFDGQVPEAYFYVCVRASLRFIWQCKTYHC